jgi:hypothetical protein
MCPSELPRSVMALPLCDSGCPRILQSMSCPRWLATSRHCPMEPNPGRVRRRVLRWKRRR